MGMPDLSGFLQHRSIPTRIPPLQRKPRGWMDAATEAAEPKDPAPPLPRALMRLHASGDASVHGS